MAFQGPEAIENTLFDVVEPIMLTPTDIKNLQTLERDSMHADYMDASEKDLDFMVQQTDIYRGDFNRGRGIVFRKKQRFITQRTVIATTLDGEPVASLSSADNASAPENTPFPLSRMMIEAKLRLDKLVEKKWHWFGRCAISKNIYLGSQPFDPNVLSIPDAMGYLLLQGKDNRQKVSTFPYREEDTWIKIIRSWGLARHPDDDGTSAYPFGPEGATIQMERWEQTSVSSTKNHIKAKEDAAELLEVVQNNTKYRLD